MNQTMSKKPGQENVDHNMGANKIAKQMMA